MEKSTLRYLKKQFRKGKGRVAGIADAVLLWIFVFLLVLSAVWGTNAALLEAAILGAAAATAVFILAAALRRHRFERFIDRIMADTALRLTLEKLVLMPAEALEKICVSAFESELGKCAYTPVSGGFLREDGVFCYAFPNHPDVPVDMRQFFGVVRAGRHAGASSLAFLSASEYSEDVSAFADRINARILGREELLKYAEKPAEKEVLSVLAEEAKRSRSRSQLKKQFLSKGKTRSYILCALLTMAWPFIFGFNIVYPMMAVFAWGLAFFSMRAQKSDAAPTG